MTLQRIGIVGLGLGRRHVKAFLSDPRVGRVVACDPEAAKLEAVRETHPAVAAVYSDIGEMLGAERLDAVSIVTPDHLHRPHAESALAAGCHVLLTKPIATTRADAEAIISAAEKHQRLLMVAQEYRFRTRFRELKALIAAGFFGEIINVRLDCIQDKREQFRRSPWYAGRDAARTVTVGTAIHEIDAIRFLVGRPVRRVQAVANDLGDLEFSGAKTVVAAIEFECGAIGQVTASYAAKWPVTGEIPDPLRLLGTRGAAIGDSYAQEGDADWRVLSQSGNDIDSSTTGCVRSFLSSLVEGKPIEITGEDALESLAVCLAIDEAVGEGQPKMLRPEGSQEGLKAAG